MSWYAIGIDPGKTGALAAIRNDGFLGGGLGLPRGTGIPLGHAPEQPFEWPEFLR